MTLQLESCAAPLESRLAIIRSICEKGSLQTAKWTPHSHLVDDQQSGRAARRAQLLEQIAHLLRTLTDVHCFKRGRLATKHCQMQRGAARAYRNADHLHVVNARDVLQNARDALSATNAGLMQRAEAACFTRQILVLPVPGGPYRIKPLSRSWVRVSCQAVQ